MTALTANTTVGVLGPGAVGCYFGGMLARAGVDVVLVGRPGPPGEHLRSIAEHGLRLEGVSVRETIRLRVASDVEALRGVRWVLCCVKSMDTADAARELAPRLAAAATVISLQNGVENVELLRAAGLAARPSVVFVAAAIERPGAVVHRGRGDLVLGDTDEDRAFAALCESAGIPCRHSDDVVAEAWTKLIINSMGNAISALAHVSYGDARRFEPAWRVSLAVADEALAVAAASGVALERERVLHTAQQVLESVGAATSSTEQDLARGRRTEIDALNGFLARRGRATGVPTPVNDTLSALVALRERHPLAR